MKLITAASVKRTAVVTFVVLFGLTLSGSVAKGGPERPPGEPPFGVAVQSDAPGTKLTGVAFIELYNPVAGNVDVRAYVRLRQGSILDAVFVEVQGVSFNPAAIQSALLAALKPEILFVFFQNNQSLDVKLKGFDEAIQKEESTLLTGTSQLILADVIFSVK